MGQLKVRDIMTTQVITLLGNDTVKDATITLAVDNLSGAPVVDDDFHLVGILSECDILKLIVKFEDRLNIENPVLHLLAFPMDAKIEDPQLKAAAEKFSEMRVADLMIKDVITTTPDAEIVDVLRIMIEKDVNRIPVLEKGVLVGIVTRGDIIFSIYKRKI
ncbi:MAG: CBS domain-containing protein [Candidatus Methanomethylophilaceae archaeon]|nr:CBS domain-containing protein [Candidatus Methanomethylophilaceae archaeon]MDY5872894.1 CBS domain-containing protein [Candidatus Methanomethylophilaceae archaeon]